MAIIQFENGTKVNFNGNPTPQDVEEVANKLGINKPVTSGAPATPTTPSAFTPPAQPKKDGFLKSLAKNLVRSTAEVGVSAFNTVQSAADLAFGQKENAARDIGASRTVPFLGEVKPAFTGNESTGEAAKKMIGYGADIGSNFIGAEGLGTVAKTGFGGLVKQAAKQGAKYGFATGALQGGGQALEENKSLGDAAASAAFGGAAGAAGGAALGAAGAGASRVARSVFGRPTTQMTEKVNKELSEYISPHLNKAEQEAAIKAGKVSPADLLHAPEVALNNDEARQVVQGIVNPKKSYIENVNTVRDALGKEAETLKGFLKENDVIFNQNQLKAKLSTVEKPELVATDQQLSTAYDRAQAKFMKFVGEEKKNMSGLLEARKKFDGWLKKEYPTLYSDQRFTPMQAAFRDMRNAANEFIADKLPEGSVYRDSLRKQSLMYDVIDNLSSKAVKTEYGKSGFRQLIKKHPTAASFVKKGALVGAGAIGARELLN